MKSISSEEMVFASSIQENKDPRAALQSNLTRIDQQLGGRRPDILFLFVSTLYQTDWEPIVQELLIHWKNPLLIGCSGGGILGADQESESTPAISLAAAVLPRVNLHPFTVSPEELEEPQGNGFWIEKLGATPADEPIGILLPEPFSCDATLLIAALTSAYPKMPLIGGLASGAHQSGENTLFFNDSVVREGAVGVLLTGDITLQTIVSQGCRPIGRPYIITKAQDNVIFELAGAPALEALRQLFTTLPESDKSLAQRALFLGVVMNEQKEKFDRGDFLVRNLVGIDPSTGAVAVGDRIQAGQTVQFQLRDAETSKEDLQHLLQEQGPTFTQFPSVGGLLFSCLGRGKDLYGEPHYDIRTIQKALGSCPLAGFFCNGEIGPVGGHNYIHGFTSSLGLFRPKSRNQS